MKAAWSALAVVLIVTALLLAYTVRTRNSPVPSTPAVRRAMLAVLPEQVDGVVYELGAGWGGLALALARRYPHNRVVGYELSPLPWALTRARIGVVGPGNLEVHRADFMTRTFADAGVVAAYLSPGAMERLRPKLAAELAGGAVLVSSTFPVPHWKPQQVVRADDQYATLVYRYVMPPEPGEPPTKPFQGFL